MWVFTETGFVSAVRHRNEKGMLMVRARDSQSLEDLADMQSAEISSSPFADYPYRVVVSDETFKSWHSMTIDMLDYDNFKSRVTSSRGNNYHDALMDVWTAMHKVEDKAARRKERVTVKTFL